MIKKWSQVSIIASKDKFLQDYSLHSVGKWDRRQMSVTREVLHSLAYIVQRNWETPVWLFNTMKLGEKWEKLPIVGESY